MTTATKADLQQKLDAATAEIEQLRQQLTELQEASPARRDHLSQVVWLQRDEPTGEQRGATRDGKLWLRFAAQYAGLNKATGRRDFGSYKDCVCYEEVAQLAEQVFASGNRLVAITAYERPWSSQRPGPRRSDWVITSITPIGRPAPTEPAAEPAPVEPAGYGEPTDEEVAF